MHIDPKELLHFAYYEYGEPYYGSFRGMRFKVAREPMKNIHFTPPDQRGEASFKVVIWPEPFSDAATPEEKKVVKEFLFTEEGLAQIAPYLDAYYDAHKGEWPAPMHARR